MSVRMSRSHIWGGGTFYQHHCHLSWAAWSACRRHYLFLSFMIEKVALTSRRKCRALVHVSVAKTSFLLSIFQSPITERYCTVSRSETSCSVCWQLIDVIWDDLMFEIYNRGTEFSPLGISDHLPHTHRFLFSITMNSLFSATVFTVISFSESHFWAQKR
jgi:hypothetical protein